jgi:uncharacterized protein (TIGR02246 family)
MRTDRTVRRVTALLATACVVQMAAATESTETELRSFFEKFVQVQNAHDAKSLESLIADSPQFLWITRGTTIWGRDAALQRFAKLYEGTWKLEPELAAMKVVTLGNGVAELHVPVVFTTGASGQPPQTVRIYLNQVVVKSDGAWRVMSIFPIAAP